MMTRELETLLTDWEYREPQMKEVAKVLDRSVRAAMKQWEPGITTPAEATAHLREILGKVRGHLPSWMKPEFWQIEFDLMKLPSTANVRVGSHAYTAIPTSLSGQRVEFYPWGTGGTKAVLPHRDLFVVADSALEAIIALGRLAEGAPRGST